MNTKSWDGPVLEETRAPTAMELCVAARRRVDECITELRHARHVHGTSASLIEASRNTLAASSQLMANIRSTECLLKISGLHELSIWRDGFDHRVHYSTKPSGYPGSFFLTVFCEYGEHTVWAHAASAEDAARFVFNKIADQHP